MRTRYSWLLRWATIILPLAFVATVLYVGQFVFPQLVRTLAGFLVLMAAVATAVFLFSRFVFALIARAEREALSHHRQLLALNTLAAAAGQPMKLEELLQLAVDRVTEAVGVEGGIACILDEKNQELLHVAYKNIPEDVLGPLRKVKLEEGRIDTEAVRTGEPVYVKDLSQDPRFQVPGRKPHFRSILSLPLKSEGKVNGILAFAAREQRHFSSADLEFLKGIGGQLGMAIRNATLYEQTLLQNRELGALLAVGKVVTSSVDLDELLGASLDTLIEVTSADAAEIWLLGADEELFMRCHRGAHREAFLERTRFAVGEGIPGLAAQSQEPIVVHDLPHDARFLRQQVAQAGFSTFCALPMRYQSKLVGVLAVAALAADALKEQRELRLLESIGEWLALAIENSRLYQQVQDVATLQERERIAREMHDGMAQTLGYINTQTMAVKKLLSNGQLREACEELTSMEEIARDLYADVREGILGLRAAAQRQNGFIPTLREYTERYTEAFSVPVEIAVSPNAERLQLPPNAEIQLLRVFQEALTNVRKHARATAVTMTFECNGHNELQVTIADNGRGFDLMRLPATGWPRFGLQTMRERAEAVGGILQIDTAPGQGTRVQVRIPVAQREH